MNVSQRLLPAFLFAVLLFVPTVFGQDLDDLLGREVSGNETAVTGPGGNSVAPTPEKPDEPLSVDDMRRKIIELAGAEVGKVDTRPGPDGFKTGWQHLVEYYEQAYRYESLEKSQPYWYKMLKKPHSYIEGGPKHWCGIFTTWAWSKAGLQVYWNTRIIGCKYRGDTKNIQPGDICIIKIAVNPNNHHCVVKSRDGNALVTIDGNQAAQNVLERKRSVSDIEIYYSVSEAMGAPVLPPPTGTGGSGTTGGTGGTSTGTGATGTGSGTGSGTGGTGGSTPPKPDSGKETGIGHSIVDDLWKTIQDFFTKIANDRKRSKGAAGATGAGNGTGGSSGSPDQQAEEAGEIDFHLFLARVLELIRDVLNLFS
jgi:hypothetical protein